MPTAATTRSRSSRCRPSTSIHSSCRSPISTRPAVGQLQLAVLAVGVVEADVQAARARARPTAGMRVQWRIASRATTASARPAVAYWKTSIARSERRPTKGSTTLSWETRESGR